jgi:TatD DNase family protein
MRMLVDTHCHLTSAALSRDLFGVCQRARAAGVTRLITVATDAADSRRAIAVADHYRGVYATVGVHPHEAAKVKADDWRLLRELRHNPNVVAWGEIGLDYHYDFADHKTQQEVFSLQLADARRSTLPVVIHCREAVADVVAMLEDHGYRDRRVVFHCFSGTSAEADAIIDRGWWLSFTGMVTFKNSKDLQAIARRYPLEQLMLETDAPYLSPEPHRKAKPNESSLLVHTAAFLADLKGISPAEMEAQTTANAVQFFGL